MTISEAAMAKRRPRADLLAIALIVVLLVFFIVGTALLIWRSFNTAEERMFAQAALSSQVVAANAEWTIETARQVLRRVDDAVGDGFETPMAEIVQRLADSVVSLPGSAKIYVVGEDGTTLFSTDPDVMPIEVRDREYFTGVRDGAAYYVSSMLVSRLNGEQIFAISKRMERNGVFVGAAVVTFNYELLRRVWESLRLDDQSTVGLIRGDGELVSRYPQPPGPLDLSNYVLFTDYLLAAPAGVYETISPADGVHRIVGYQTVRGSDLIAVASIGVSPTYAATTRGILTGLVVVIPTALALAYAAYVVWRLLQREGRNQERLAALVDTNQMLLREVHHRVKNNLQSVIALVNMQKGDPALKQNLKDRISAMVAVHEHIYGNDQFAAVDAGGYVANIAQGLLASYGRPVAVSYDIEPMMIDRDHATPLGLIINEAVSNALKYAFTEDKPAELKLALRRVDAENGQLVVEDNGVGFDPDETSKGMGTRLIHGLVNQMSGEARYERDNGTRFIFNFPLAEAATTA